MLQHSRVRVGAVLVSMALAFGSTIPLMALSAAPASAAESSTAPPLADNPATAVTTDPLPTAQINGVVWDQVVVGNTVYAAGEFSAARPAGSAVGTNESPRYNLMSYSLTTGVMTSWAPNVNGRIRTIAASPDGTKVFIGGSFSQVNGQTRSRIAAFNTADGSLSTTFKPSVNSDVFGIAATNSVVYLGGWFTAIGATPRAHLAALDPTSGAVTGWAPQADHTVYGLGVTTAGDRVVVAGSFSTLNGATATSIGSLSASDGTSYPFAANQVVHNTGNSAALMSLKVVNDKAYAGSFWFGGTGNFEGGLVTDAYDGTILNMANCLGDTYDVAPMNGLVYMVSHHHQCTDINGFTEQSPRIHQHTDAVTEQVTGLVQTNTYGYPNFEGNPSGSYVNWFPAMTVGTYSDSGQAGWTVESAGDYLLVGGEFPFVNATAQQGLVRFTTRANGAPHAVGGSGTRASITPVLRNLTATSTRVRFASDFDRDGLQLSYKVIRNDRGVNNPVYTTTGTSTFWQRPNLQFTDTGLVTGQSYSYYVMVTDADGNNRTSNTVSIVAGTNVPDASAYSQQVAADGATHYWRLDEGAGSATSTDWVTGNDLNVSAGVTMQAGGAVISSPDTAATFAGTDTGFAVSSQPLTGPDVFTEELWFNTTSSAGGKLLGFGDAKSGLSSSYDRHLYLGDDGRLTFGIYNNGFYTIASGKSYNDGAWHHVAASLSPAGMVLYVDGLKVGANTGTTNGQPFTGYWRVGGDNTGAWANAGSSNYVNAVIDDVAIYPTALTRDQIRDHYTKSGRTVNVPPPPSDDYGKAVVADDPTLYWRLGEASGTTAADASGNENAGTYYDGPGLGAASDVVATDTAVTFDGSDDLVTSNRSFDNPTTFSEEAWFKTTTTSGGKIMGFGTFQTGTSGGYDRHVYMNGAGQLRFGAYTGALNVAAADKAYNDNVWHHVVATLGGDGMKLYVDGALVATHANTGVQAYTGYWRVGGDNTWEGDNWFDGSVDEYAVYDQVLPVERVRAHYRASGASHNTVPTGSIGGSCLASGVCTGLSADVTDPDGSVSALSWDFGDGATAGNQTSVDHTYTATGTYTITLTAVDDQGGTASFTKTVTVKTLPPVPTDAYGAAVAADSPYLYWRLGEAAGPTAIDYSRFGNDGTYVGAVELQRSSPVAGGDTAAGFVADGDEQVVSSDWYGDPTTFTSEAWFNTTTPGGRILGVSAAASGRSGGYDRHIFLNNAGQLVFGVWTGAETTITSPGTYVDGQWHHVAATFGSGGMALYVDGNLVGTNTNTWVAPSDGHWRVGSDNVWSASGRFVGTIDEVAVYDRELSAAALRAHYRASTAFHNQAPTASIDVEKAGLQATFTGTGADADGTVAGYEWSFGDGDTSTQQSPTHTYAAAGTYQVQLKVTDDLGGATTAERTLTVRPTPGTPSDAYGAAVVASDPLLYWRLADTTGTKALDQSTHASDGTYFGDVGRGVTSPVASGNKAADFNGAGNWVASDEAYANPTVFSVEAWFRTKDHGDGKIAGFGNNRDSDSGNYDRHVYLDGGHVVFGVYDGSLNTIQTSGTYNDDQWHHVVATFGPSGRALYVDGVEQASAGAAGAQTYTGYWRAGRDSGWVGTNDFDGLIDEVAVYGSVLSADAVAAHYAASTVGNAAPTADFAATCTGADCALVATAADSDGTVVAYDWQFGDGTTGTGASVNHTWAEGTWSVTLTVTDNHGATTSVTHDVVVDVPNQAPVARIGTPAVTDRTVTLDGSTSDDPDGTVATWEWAFGDGETGTGASVSHTYATGGSYTVTLTVTDNEGATTATTVTVNVDMPNQAPVARIGEPVVTDLDVSLSGATSSDADGTIVGYAWDLGDGTTATTALVDHHYANPGSYTVVLTVTDDDGESDSETATVVTVAPNQLPTASFTATPTDLSVAVDAGASQDPDGTIASYAWQFGDGATASGATASHDYAAGGTFTVTLTVTDNRGGTDTTTRTVIVVAPNQLPKASFTATPTDLNVAVDGSASSDDDGTIAAWAWTFGDGATATGATASHTYAGAGEKTVTLTVTDNRGGTDTTTKTVTVVAPNQAPTAVIADPVVTDLAVSVSGSGSSDADGTVSSYAWAFGDGGTGTGATASHTYAVAGTYPVTLVVTDDDGATGTTSRDVTVTAPAVTTIARDTFTRTSASGWGTAEVGGAWTVNSASTMTIDGSSAVARITAAGSSRQATLNGVSARDVSIVTDLTLDKTPAGANYYQYYLARVSGTTYYLLTARFETNGTLRVWLSKVVSGTETALKTTVLTGFNYAGGETLKVRFEVAGNGTTNLAAKVWRASGAEPAAATVAASDSTAVLQAAGALSVKFYTGSGTTSLPLTIKVADYLASTPGVVANVKPTASFTASPTDLTVAVDADASSDSDGTITSYAWNFGDGATGTGKTASHTYATAGSYTVTLVVTDDDGATDTTTRSVTVTAPVPNEKPTASFTASPTDLTVAVDADASSDPDGTITSYAWNFGDGATGTGKTASHTYATAGTYTVTLVVTDDDGDTDTTTRSATVTAPTVTTVAKDAFERTSTSGWGTAQTGGAWTVNSASTMTLDGSSAVARITAAGSSRQALLNAVSARDTSTVTDVTLDKAPVGGNYYHQLLARVSGTTTYYMLVARLDANGYLRVYVSRMVSGTETVLRTVSVSTFNYVAGEKLKVRFDVTGTGTTTLAGKVWRAADAEPTAFTVSATDSTAALQSAGGLGLRFYTGSGMTSLPLTIKVGDYTSEAK